MIYAEPAVEGHEGHGGQLSSMLDTLRYVIVYTYTYDVAEVRRTSGTDANVHTTGG